MLDTLKQAGVLPKPNLWRRLSSLPLFSYYHRLFALVMVCNGVVVWQGPGVQAMGVETLSTMVLINLSLATLIRQQYVINTLFWLATRMPTGWPLCLRRRVAKVYHLGGLHSGGAVAAPCVGQGDYHGGRGECGDAVQIGAVRRHGQRYWPGVAASVGRQCACAVALVDPPPSGNLR